MQSQAGLSCVTLVRGGKLLPCPSPRSSALENLLYYQQEHVRLIPPPPCVSEAGTGQEAERLMLQRDEVNYLVHSDAHQGKHTIPRVCKETEPQKHQSDTVQKRKIKHPSSTQIVGSCSAVEQKLSKLQPLGSSGLHLPSPSTLKSTQLAELSLWGGHTPHPPASAFSEREEQQLYSSLQFPFNRTGTVHCSAAAEHVHSHTAPRWTLA